MVSVAILGIVSAGVVTLMTGVQRSYGVEDARVGLKIAAQTAINKMALNLTACKRLFQNNAGDNAYLALVQLGAGAPSVMSGAALPGINDGASMSPSSSTFVASAVGNSLFFASLDLPFTTAAPIADSSASTHTLRVDSYHFNYYYLAQNAQRGVGGQNQVMLQEWHSVSFADYSQVTTWSDATLQANLVKALFAAGYTGAWDPSQASVSSAFYTLSAAGAITPLSPKNGATLAQKTTAAMIQIITGTLGYGYRYGVALNTGGAFQLPYSVPQFATASGNFPSGLEVVVVGASSARQVLMRLVLAAEGVFNGDIASQQVVLATARDIH
jgi:hypothetical protein